jgi:hypothetical protein
MLVDECDKYELPDITDTFSFNFSTADSWVKSRIVSGREVGVENVKGSGLNQTKQINVFLYHFQHIHVVHICHIHQLAFVLS